jgi:hypothetical protein
MFLNYFDVLMSKIIFKNKKYYFNTFLSENILKNNHNHTLKHPLTQISKSTNKNNFFLKKGELYGPTNMFFKSPFVCVVASAFEATTAKQMFGYVKNTIYF